MSDNDKNHGGARGDLDKPARRVGPRQHHVAAHQVVNQDGIPTNGYDEIVVFGTELEALRHIVGKPGWVYQTLANGQAFTEAGS